MGCFDRIGTSIRQGEKVLRMYRSLKSDSERVVLVWRGHCLLFWINLPDGIIQSKQWNKNFMLRVPILCSPLELLQAVYTQQEF